MDRIKTVAPVVVFMLLLMTIAGFGTRLYFQHVTYASTLKECQKDQDCVGGVKKHFVECFAVASKRVTAKRLILGTVSQQNPLFEIDRPRYVGCLNTTLGKEFFHL